MNKLIRKQIFGFLLCIILSISILIYYNRNFIVVTKFWMNIAVEDPVNLTNRSIFFLETSHINKDEIFLNARQCCAIESAALMNPTMNVHLLIFTDAIKYTNETKIYLSHLANYKNIVIKHEKILKFVENTPIQKWWRETDVLKNSQWPIAHSSDILRLVTMWKYGGIYFDLDVVVKTSFNKTYNFAGAEDSYLVANGILGFEKKGVGHEIVNECLKKLMKNFRGDIWIHNGPRLLTEVLQELCQIQQTDLMTREQCHGFEVYPQSKVYPIHWQNWERFFDVDKEYEETMLAIDNAMIVHIWNKLSASRTIKVGSNAPYAIVASRYCPRIYNNCGETF